MCYHPQRNKLKQEKMPVTKPQEKANHFKDDAYYCYCAYVLRISRYSDFLSAVLIDTGIFLRGSKLCGESRTLQMLFVSKQKIGSNHAFLREN